MIHAEVPPVQGNLPSFRLGGSIYSWKCPLPRKDYDHIDLQNPPASLACPRPEKTVKGRNYPLSSFRCYFHFDFWLMVDFPERLSYTWME